MAMLDYTAKPPAFDARIEGYNVVVKVWPHINDGEDIPADAECYELTIFEGGSDISAQGMFGNFMREARIINAEEELITVVEYAEAHVNMRRPSFARNNGWQAC